MPPTAGRASTRFRDLPWDLLIVDRKLPHLDGLTMVRTLREAGMLTPVLFLTTLGGIDDRVDGLNAGADDYLVKPFAFSELDSARCSFGTAAPSNRSRDFIAGR